MGSYEEAFERLNKTQRLAVTTTEGPVLVVAGPGTGKTQLLTTRIAHILATTDALPENILCLTFTDSAAQTMRERLTGMIGQAAYDVMISTYHAFGSDLVRRFPDYFAAYADTEPIDDVSLDQLVRQIIAALPYGNPLKYSDTYVGDIKTLISDAKRALLTPNDVREIARHNLAFIAKHSTTVGKTLQALVRISKKELGLFESLLQTFESGAEAIPAHGIAPLQKLCTEELREALGLTAESGKTTPVTKWKQRWLAKDNDGRFVLDGQKTNEKLLAAADVYEQYLEALQARKLFDYDDMILRAVQALSTHNDFRYTLQEKYLYILLDEFQDTNGAQLQLVKLLTDNPVSEGRPNVLAVGDDDQAIYAFQGANYSHMLQFHDMYRDVLVVPLTQNYRSHADILHTARGIAEQVEERLHHHFPGIEKTLTAENADLPAAAVVERREARSEVIELAWTTARISQLIKEGVPPSEIAVLAPQHKYLVPLVPFLQQAGVPVRYDKRENVLEDPAVNQLLRMAELCLALGSVAENHSSSDALWAEVLSFDCWQLPTSLIWRLSWQANDDGRDWTTILLDDDTLKPIALFFMRLSQLAASETLETMLDYLVGTTPLDLAEPGYEPFSSPYYKHHFGDMAYGQASAEAWELLTNLVVLRARLREYKQGDERLTLGDFIAFVEAHRAAELKILNSSPYASHTDAVQLMTAYKAKGMEFAAVFVLSVSDESWGSRARGGGSRISLPPNMQFIRYAGATNDERLRLFYVAITRAKTQLYLMSHTSTFTGKTLSHLKYLDEAEDDLYNTISPLLPAGKQTVLPAEEQAQAPTTELAAYWQRRHEAALAQPDMHSLLHDRLEQYQLSPTHLNDFTDVAHCGPQTFFLRTILRFPHALRPEMHYGNAVHETLEWVHTVTKQEGLLPSKQAVTRVFEQRLRGKRMRAHDEALFLERGQAALAAYLAQRASTFLPDDMAEYSFRNEGVFAGTAHLAGKIDKLVIDRSAKTITIVDYKTGKGYSRWAHEVKLHKYRQQLYLYRALVEGSHTFAGYSVVGACLEFVEPDEDGRIHTLQLEFDDAEYRRIKRLAEVVWQRIKAIDLPNITAYSQDMSGVETFETDLLA